MKIRFLAPAETEMLDAAAYYEMQVENLGANFLDVSEKQSFCKNDSQLELYLPEGHYVHIIEAAVAEIAKYPETWPKIEQGIQRRLVRRFPYSILYAVHENEIIIVAVMHQKQKPRYWMDRL